jgi:NAD(P)-dependent dehydrogenase (short-subunit alcohol dehydrogenase family)
MKHRSNRTKYDNSPATPTAVRGHAEKCIGDAMGTRSGQGTGLGRRYGRNEARIVKEVLPNAVGRVGRIDDIATLVAFVASPLAGFINGANLRVDGGAVQSVN